MTKAIFKSTAVRYGAPGYPERSGERVTILYELGEDRRDSEVGRMFRIQFVDGIETDAFEDELRETV